MFKILYKSACPLKIWMKDQCEIKMLPPLHSYQIYVSLLNKMIVFHETGKLSQHTDSVHAEVEDLSSR